MSIKKDSFKLINTIGIFSIIYIVPLFINFYQMGGTLRGDKYQIEIAYIENLNQLLNHLFNNFFSYLNFFNNPVFWFFISAYFTQKAIKWSNS